MSWVEIFLVTGVEGAVEGAVLVVIALACFLATCFFCF